MVIKCSTAATAIHFCAAEKFVTAIATWMLFKSLEALGADSSLPTSLGLAQRFDAATGGVLKISQWLKTLLDCSDCKELTCIRSARMYDLLSTNWLPPNCSTHLRLKYYTTTMNRLSDLLLTFWPVMLTTC